MLSSVRPQLITFESKCLSKLKGHRGALQVNLGAPFQVLLDADPDIRTPSPLTICFDLLKPTASSPLRSSHWDDSDSDSDAETDADADEAQVIEISPNSPFYTPHPPPTFRTAFDVPPVPCESQVISISSDSPFYTPPSPPSFKTTFDLPPLASSPSACLEHANSSDSTTAAVLFRDELKRLLPPVVQEELFLIDEESLKSLDEELVSAPLDAFMDVCLARLDPAEARSVEESKDSSETQNTDLPHYHLASFLDLHRHDAISQNPELCSLFHRRAVLPERSPASAHPVAPIL